MLSYVDNIIDLVDLYFETNNKQYLNKVLNVTLKILPNANSIVINEIEESLTTAIKSLNKNNKDKYLSYIKTYIIKNIKAFAPKKTRNKNSAKIIK